MKLCLDISEMWSRCKIACLITTFGAFLVVCGLAAKAQKVDVSSDLEFHSSDPQLNQSFRWAKHQALAYVRPASSPIGEWYEAALPGRNAFCMRDVSHQTTGAAALGLFAANRNMLGRFADAVSPTRDWAGYWEIDGNGNPSTADYVSDADFWYNLPANFDVLDAIVRMWRWTGDDSYGRDPRMRRFFRTSLTDYILEWKLAPDSILKRSRIENQRDTKGRFVQARGIPSYTEDAKDFNLGTDLLASEYRAMRSFGEIATSKEDKQLAAQLDKSAIAIQHILEMSGWSSRDKHFYGALRGDLSCIGSGDVMALYFDAVKDPVKVKDALVYISDPKYWKKINIEEESYIPGVLFHYGRSDTAYQVLSDLSAPEKPRREYPEVSYAVIAAIVSGAMGIEPSATGDKFDLSTLAQPMSQSERLSVQSLRIRGNLVNVTHNGEISTSLENRSGPAIRWKAEFKGHVESLYERGHALHVSHENLRGEVPVSWVVVTVPSGATVIISRNKKIVKLHSESRGEPL